MQTPSASEESKQGKADKPKGSNLGLIIGLVIGGVFIIALIVAAILIQRRRVVAQAKKEETPWDPTTEFYHRTEREQIEEMTVDYNNPMYDGEDGAHLEGDVDEGFSDHPDEML
jgi:hypothetical protein